MWTHLIRVSTCKRGYQFLWNGVGSVPAKRGCHLWVKNTWSLLWLAVERPQLVLDEPFSLSFLFFVLTWRTVLTPGLNVWVSVVRVMNCHQIAANCIWVHFWGQTWDTARSIQYIYQMKVQNQRELAKNLTCIAQCSSHLCMLTFIYGGVLVYCWVPVFLSSCDEYLNDGTWIWLAILFGMMVEINQWLTGNMNFVWIIHISYPQQHNREYFCSLVQCIKWLSVSLCL